MSKSIQSAPELVHNTLYYKQAEEYSQPTDLIEYFIHIMYLRLIRDVLDNRAMNEHIALTINKLKSMVKDIGNLIDFNDDDFGKRIMLLL